MFSKFEFFIAVRYLRSKQKEGFISVTSWFSLIGIMLGVATLIIVMAVMNGFRNELLSHILGMNNHITVSGYSREIKDFDNLVAQIKSIGGVEYAQAMINEKAMVTHNGGATGALVVGMRYDDIVDKKLISDNIKFGRLENLKDPNQITIGIQLARNMGVTVGDELNLISPQANATFIGMIPRFKSYEVGAIFEVGMYEYDNTAIFMPLEAAQKFFKYPNSINSIGVLLGEANTAPSKKFEISEQIGKFYYLSDWQDSNSQLFNALDVERNVMFLILTLIILIAAFNIISSMIMLVHDKGRSIAILRTMGTSRTSIMKVFFLCGISIGLIGTILGTILGISFAYNIKTIQHYLENILGNKLFDPVVYFLSELPADVNNQEVASVVVIALFLSFIATLYPAWKASKQHPAQALRQQ
jgi:lipoprotein-releasing system permease protein